MVYSETYNSVMWMPSWLSRTFSQGPACSVHQTTPTKRGQAHRWRPILIARSESKRTNSKRTDPVWIEIAWPRFKVLNEFMQSAPVVTLAKYSATFPSQFMTAKVGKYETNLQSIEIAYGTLKWLYTLGRRRVLIVYLVCSPW